LAQDIEVDPGNWNTGEERVWTIKEDRVKEEQGVFPGGKDAQNAENAGTRA
jgi:hypothetical protein